MNHRINPDAHAHVRIACDGFHAIVLHTNCFTAAKLCIDESHINLWGGGASSISLCLFSVTLGPNEFLIIYRKVKGLIATVKFLPTAVQMGQNSYCATG